MTDLMYLGPYDEDDAADDTDSSRDEVERAWHDARDDAQADPDTYTDDWDRD